ncbi:hypothetical protein LOTGIDRAFT_218866 [Lottia gigantea]|uniref:hydroxymethylbilane synthase n=1 Tax=Lottia gigantea TaxID=225164 RepID=V3ZYN3_LOTGI|nr:hypothetical protein LOTGIDRAFT_218866 [Lottia gigantea]ESO89497.1 hypothetical protein LOTGIDRAFT_218866 [Lottia gigantea]
MSENKNDKVFVVGSRKSQLALIQTNTIITKLKECHPGQEFHTITMTTTGDNILDSALSKIGEKSLFTRELENALKEKQVHFVVHSLKDLPTTLPDGLTIGCVYRRDDPYDAVVMSFNNRGKTLATLPPGSIIGTSSLRRAAQIKRKYPHFEIKDIRGNLNTRFKKLNDSNYDAIILAKSGLERMDWHTAIGEVLTPDVCMYCVGQGALAVECRANDEETLRLLAPLHHNDTAIRCIAERAYLKKLEGGCSVPVCVQTELNDTELMIRGGVFSIGGQESVVDSLTVELPLEDTDTEPQSKYAGIMESDEIPHEAFLKAENAGIELAEKLFKQGADEILKKTKKIMADEVRKEQARKEEEKAAAAAASKEATSSS